MDPRCDKDSVVTNELWELLATAKVQAIARLHQVTAGLSRSGLDASHTTGKYQVRSIMFPSVRSRLFGRLIARSEMSHALTIAPIMIIPRCDPFHQDFVDQSSRDLASAPDQRLDYHTP